MLSQETIGLIKRLTSKKPKWQKDYERQKRLAAIKKWMPSRRKMRQYYKLINKQITWKSRKLN